MAAAWADTEDDFLSHDFSPELVKDVCEFRIVIDKREGGSMGIDIDFEDNATLFIEAVREGLVHAWNARNRRLAVKPGHRIVEVNGFEGNAADLIYELRKDDVLNMTIRCQQDTPGYGQSYMSTEDTDCEVRSFDIRRTQKHTRPPSPGSSDNGTTWQEDTNDERRFSPEQQRQFPSKQSTGNFHNTTSWQKDDDDDERPFSLEQERRFLRQLSPGSSFGGNSWQKESDDEEWFLRQQHRQRQSQRQQPLGGLARWPNWQKDVTRNPAHECYTNQHSSLPAQPGQGGDSQSLVTFAIYAVPVHSQVQPPSSAAAGPALMHHGPHLADQVHRGAGRAEAAPDVSGRARWADWAHGGARGAEAAPGPAPIHQGAHGADCVHREPASRRLLWPGAPRWPPGSWPARPRVDPSDRDCDPIQQGDRKSPITTLTINHLPIELTQDELLDLLDTSGFKGCYDYVYLPGDERSENNLGHAFVSLRTPEDAERLFAAWHGGRMHGFSAAAPVLSISVSRMQGSRANSRRWTAARLRCVPPSLHPFIAR